jgi:hypothetical protein
MRRRNNQQMLTRKYANCEHMPFQGVRVRKLTPREIERFLEAVNARPLRPIRLKVPA